MRPFFPYYGSKWRLAKRFPVPVGTIVEPFAGSAGYAVRYGEDREVVLVEKDPVVAALWEWLLTATAADIMDLPDDIDTHIDDYGLPPGAAALVGFWLNKGAARPCKTPSKWAKEYRRPGDENYWGGGVKQRLIRQIPHIKGWSVLEGDYTAAPDIEATWHIDPPYIGAGKHYPQGAAAINYDDLAGWCRTRRGQVMVCENLGAAWLPFQPIANMRSNRKQGKEQQRVEVMWTSGAQQETLFPIPG